VWVTLCAIHENQSQLIDFNYFFIECPQTGHPELFDNELCTQYVDNIVRKSGTGFQAIDFNRFITPD